MLERFWNDLSASGSAESAWLLVRCTVAATAALGITLLVGRALVPWLRRREVLEHVEKTDSPELAARHSSKRGTPTMGGLVFLPGIVAATLLCARWSVPAVPLCVGVVLAFAWIGYRDDRIKLTCPDRAGLGKRRKLRLQILVSIVAALALGLLDRGRDPGGWTVVIPLVPEAGIDLGFLGGLPFLAFAVLVLTGSSNAVNLSDGLDGLAAGCSALAYIAFAAIGIVAGSSDLAALLAAPHVPGSGEVAVFASAVAGSCLGFLWFNSYPARVFMGDTGALALGAGLGIAALAVRREFLLVVAGGVFVAEALSVILQVFSFRCFGKRIFRIAPYHHHLQFGGWPEWKVTSRLWLAGAVLAIVSVATLPFG